MCSSDTRIQTIQLSTVAAHGAHRVAINFNPLLNIDNLDSVTGLSSTKMSHILPECCWRQDAEVHQHQKLLPLHWLLKATENSERLQSDKRH